MDSLQRNERPVGLSPVRRIFDALLIQETPQLELPAAKFIELYNDLPGILSAYAITVNLTAASYQSRDYQQAVFDRQPQGNYWIIMTTTDRGWLVPNPTKNTSTLNSLNFAFDLSTLTQTATNHSHLLVPALVQLLPTVPATWKVTQRGQLGETRSRIPSGTDTAALDAEIRALRQELRSVIDSLQAKDANREEQLDNFMILLKYINHEISTLRNGVQLMAAEQGEHRMSITNLSDQLQSFRNGMQLMAAEQDEHRMAITNLSDRLQSFRNGMQLMAAEQDEHRTAITNLFDQLQALTNLCQEQQKQAADAIQQQSIENKKIYSQQKDLYKATNHQTELLNKMGAVRAVANGTEIKDLSDRLQALTNLYQEQQKQAAAAIQKQSLENEKIYSQQKELYKATNRQNQLLNEMGAVRAITPQLLSIVTGMVIESVPPPAALSDEEQIVAEYNLKPHEIPQDWREHFMSVSLDPEAFIRLRDGDDSNIVFNRDRKGNYLILPRGGYYYLVPNKQRKIISQIYVGIKVIYDCDGYSESYREFHLVKPALVSDGATDCWRLIRKGILQFM